MSSINIPGLGFAQPNESLPPMATDHTENPNTATTATSEQTTTQQPETTSEAPAAAAVESNDAAKEEDVDMGESRPAELAQFVEGGTSHAQGHESMEVEKLDETAESSAPATATEEKSAPSDVPQPTGEPTIQIADQDSLDQTRRLRITRRL